MEIRDRRLPPALAPLAASQFDVVGRAQLRRLSPAFGRDRVRTELLAQRWQAPARNVVVLHNGPVTREQAWQVALAAHGDQLAALAGLTAAEAQGLRGFEAPAVHIVVPRGSRVRVVDGVKVHESRRFVAADLHPARVPAMVRLERAMVDAAVWSHNPRRACAVVASAVQQRLTTPDRLLAELEGAGKVAHRRLLSAVLVDVGGGAHALSELDFIGLCRRHGLPDPRLQVVRRDRDGRRRWLDAVFDLPDGRELVVEVDGAAHLCVQQYADDLDRTIELVIDGKTVVRVAAVTLRLAEDRVADQLARLLGCRPVRRRAAQTPRSV